MRAEMMMEAIKQARPLDIISKYRAPTEKRGTFQFDRILEDKLAEILRDMGFEGVIIGEERGNRGGDESRGTVVIDPVDGSVNASKGLPFFCVLMFYTTGKYFEDVEASAVYDPIRDRFYIAERGKGARIVEKGAEWKAKMGDEIEEPLVIDVTHARMMTKVDKLRKFGSLRRLGSIGLATAMTVEGRLDAVMDISRSTRPLDVVASLLVVREAGGKVVIDADDVTGFNHINFIAGKRQVVNLLARSFWWRRRR